MKINPTTITALIGAAAIVTGTTLIYVPAGFIVGGALLLAEVATSRPTPTNPKEN